MSEFHLRIVTPDRLFYDDMAEGLIVDTTEGQMMVLPNHINFVAILKVGKATIKAKGEYKEITVAGGMLKVTKENTTLISHAVEYLDEIDLARAQEAKDRLEKLLVNAKGEKEVEVLEYKLKKSINRINAKDL